MGKFQKRFEDIMAAAAFAEAGEFETARQMLGNEKVLLVVTGSESDRKSFKYALNIAKRIGAAVELLYVAGKEESNKLLEDFEARLREEGVRYRLVRKGGCIKTGIIEHTSRRSDIQFVVVESNDILNADCQGEDRSLKGALKKLKCPLVLVSELECA